MLTVRLATEADAYSMAPRLRQADLVEIAAGGRNDPTESLLEGIQSPDPCYVAVDEHDSPHVIFGTSPSPDPLVGFVWMMATDGIKDNWVQILRETPTWMARIWGRYSILTNAVHASNAIHIRWLRWAGFTFLRAIEYNEHTFYEFAKITSQEGR